MGSNPTAATYHFFGLIFFGLFVRLFFTFVVIIIVLVVIFYKMKHKLAPPGALKQFCVKKMLRRSGKEGIQMLRAHQITKLATYLKVNKAGSENTTKYPFVIRSSFYHMVGRTYLFHY